MKVKAEMVRSLLTIIGFSISGISIAAFGQEASELGYVTEDFEISSTDENGVDIISGSVRLESSLLSIGSEGHSLSYSVITPSLAQTGSADPVKFAAEGFPTTTIGSRPFKFDNYSGGVSISGLDNCDNWIEFGGNRADFCGLLTSPEGLRAKDGSNATLTEAAGLYTYTTAQGVKYYAKLGHADRTQENPNLGLQKMEFPDGYVIEIARGNDVVSITDNRGLQIRAETSDGWANTTVTGFNMAVEYCAPLAASCTFTKAWPTATIFEGTASLPAIATDMTGQTTKLYPRTLTGTYAGNWTDPDTNVQYISHQYYKVKPAGADETATIEYTFCGPWNDTSCALISQCQAGPDAPPAEQCKQLKMSANKVSEVSKNGKTWTYDFDYSEN